MRKLLQTNYNKLIGVCLFTIFLILASLKIFLYYTVYAQSTTTQIFPIIAGSDDVIEDGTAFEAINTTVWIGTGASTTASYTGLRFQNITIPKGATITSAKLNITSSATTWTSIGVIIAADIADNSGTFTASSKPSQRTLTTAQKTHSSNIQWTVDTTYTLDDVPAVIQEVINLPNWQSGNSISLILKGTGNAYGRKFIRSFEGQSAQSAKLEITYTSAQPSNNQGDINGDGTVTLSDLSTLLANFGKTISTGDTNGDGTVNLSDLSILLSNFGKVVATASPTAPPTATATPATPTPSPAGPTPTAGSTSGEWTQFGHDPQRTSYTSAAIPPDWKYKWQWNGAGADGKRQAGHLESPDLVQPITGGGRIYTVTYELIDSQITDIPSNRKNFTAIALSKTDGSVIWQNGSLGILLSTPVYDQESLYVASGNGNLYKLNAATGDVVGSPYASGAAVNLTPLLVGNYIYVVNNAGTLHKINKSTMVQAWAPYAGGSPGATPASYSPSRDAIIFITQDLYVHAVNNTNGTRKWRVKPTNRVYQCKDLDPNNPNDDPCNIDSSGAQAEEGWPVIAEQHGLVFIRYRLDWNTLWTWNPYPTTNAEIKADLTSQPNVQALFPLSLDTGAQAFVPAVGNGGAGDGGTLPMGPQPVIRTIGGQEVAYIIWRNGLTCAGGWCDGREDAAMGEMVLDNSTVSGYSAGDVRFVQYIDIQTDEMMNIAMSGDVIFHSHWLINAAKRITDRSASRGSTFTNPITTTDARFLIWRQCNLANTCNYPGCTGNTVCGINCAPSSSRFCSNGLYSYGDARSYPAGFYEYNNDMSGGSTPFTVVSDGMVLIKTNDGAIIALENGSPTAQGYSTQPVAQQKTSSTQVMGSTIQKIDWQQAKNFIGQYVTVEGTIASAVDHRPKAIYLGFKNPHDGALLVRVFEKDLSKFSFNPMTLKGKRVRISGIVSPYWPEGMDPEIVVSDPKQIEIL